MVTEPYLSQLLVLSRVDKYTLRSYMFSSVRKYYISMQVLFRCFLDTGEVEASCQVVATRTENSDVSRRPRSSMFPDFLAPPPPTSRPQYRFQASYANSPLPFIPSKFGHACPTRAPGDHSRSVLGTFFQGPVSGEKKKETHRSPIHCLYAPLFPFEYPLTPPLVAERTFDRDPSLYSLSLQQMIENDYPIPSYMSDVVSDSRRQGTDPTLHHQLRLRHRRIRQAQPKPVIDYLTKSRFHRFSTRPPS